MTVNHSDRIRSVVKAALKEAAMGEPFGFAAEFCFAPQFAQAKDGAMVMIGVVPAWFITVTIRSGGLGEPDLGNGIPVFAALPPDELLKKAAVEALESCRQQREAADKQTMDLAKQGLAQAIERRG